VTLPEPLLQRIEKLVHGHPALGWATVAEYVRDAIRRALEEDEPRK